MNNMKTLLWVVALLLGTSGAAHASRLMMSNKEAWKDSSVMIVKGKVTQASHDVGARVALYDFSVSEVIKPKDPAFSTQVTVIDNHYLSTAMIPLHKDMNAVLFLTRSGEGYISYKEIDLDVQQGVEQLAGLRIFLDLMAIPQTDKRAAACIKAWKEAQSPSVKEAVLDAVFESPPSADYAPLLLAIAKGQDTARARSWAITILSPLASYDQIKELIPLLNDPNYDVKRQLLGALGNHKAKEAISPIEAFLAENLEETHPKHEADFLRGRAQEALAKIRGENISPYWKN
jgi:HEAT repeat protein